MIRKAKDAEFPDGYVPSNTHTLSHTLSLDEGTLAENEADETLDEGGVCAEDREEREEKESEKEREERTPEQRLAHLASLSEQLESIGETESEKERQSLLSRKGRKPR